MPKYKCPKCSKFYEGPAKFCPFCGTEIKSTTVFDREEIVIASRIKEPNSSASGVWLIIFGLVAVPAIFGIILIIAGAAMLGENDSSNKVDKECIYYKPQTRKIVLYSYDGYHASYNLSQIENIIVKNSKRLRVRVRNGKKLLKIKCGFTSTPKEQIEKSLTNLRKWEEKYPK